MKLKRLSTNQSLVLDTNSPLNIGGEGAVYEIKSEPQLVAKLYHKPSHERSSKLHTMVRRQPNLMTTHSCNHQDIAWPIDLLQMDGRKQQVIGFLMCKLVDMRPLVGFYNPQIRRQKCPRFNYRYLVRTAHNLTLAANKLHKSGYVIGDVNESNLLVSNSGLVTLIDADSFQVRDFQKNATYRCLVGKPEFTPPELQGLPFDQMDRRPEHDLFGLAVLLFLTLMEGVHPFAGIYTGRGDAPSVEQRIIAGHFPYAQHSTLYRPMPAALGFEFLNPQLQDLFRQCFVDGHSNPLARPGLESWRKALSNVENSLAVCHINRQHVYSNHLSKCPWCERKARWNIESFEPISQPISGPSKGVLPKQPTVPSPPTATNRSLVNVVKKIVIASLLVLFSAIITKHVAEMFILSLQHVPVEEHDTTERKPTNVASEPSTDSQADSKDGEPIPLSKDSAQQSNITATSSPTLRAIPAQATPTLLRSDSANKEDNAQSTRVPIATPAPPNNSQYEIANIGHDNTCATGNGGYILGSVVDTSGAPIADIHLRLHDEWGNDRSDSISKSGANDFGKFDFPLFGQRGTFRLSVVEENGEKIGQSFEIETVEGVDCHQVVLQKNW